MANPDLTIGRRLLAHHVADIARKDPGRTAYTIPKDPKTYSKGYRVVTYSDFERGVDRLAWFLEEKLGKSTALDTLAYIGPNDIRYFMLSVAVPKARYKILFTSPRNSVSNHLHLLRETNCSVFLKGRTTNIDHIVKASNTPLHVVDIPEVEMLLEDGHVSEYPFDYEWEDIKHDPALIMHSSGSTGQVKVISWDHRCFSAVDNFNLLTYEGMGTVVHELESNVLNTMPYFHAAALFVSVLGGSWCNKSPALYPSEAPVSLDGVIDCIENVPLASAIIAPSMVEEASHSPKALQALGKLKMVGYAGGAINETAGDIVSDHVKLRNYIGTTECGPYPVYPIKDRREHAYFQFDPNATGLEFRHATEDLYELVFVRHDGIQYQFIFNTFPELIEYHSSDLYRKHPTKPGMWKHAGRADDVIVLSNGEKVSPSFMENMLGAAPNVRSVLLYGSKRFEIAAIIEPLEEAKGLSNAELLETIAPYITRANKQVPGHAQLSKDRIVFTAPDKPMVRLPKGTVARTATFREYELELDEVYDKESTVQTSDKPMLEGADEQQTIEVLAGLVGQISELPDLPVNQDFFQAGVDSLQVITIVRYIKAKVTA